MTTAATAIDDRADELLRELAGPGAAFREHQLEAVRDLVADRARVLCVQRTGWGKSAVYFVATALRARGGRRPDADRLAAAGADAQPDRGGRAARHPRAHRSTRPTATRGPRSRALLAADAVDLLLISPERLNNPQFRAEMLPLFAERVGLLVVDEAHCISDWGHDFRPDYRRIADMLERLPEGVAVLCTTATANDRVVADVDEQLSVGRARRAAHLPRAARAHEPALRGRRPPRRRPTGSPGWRSGCRELPGSGIVYTLTKRDADLVAEWLSGARDRGRGLQRRGRDRRPRRGRGAAAAQRPQGGRRHQRARDGLRQARPRLRRALPGAGLA